MQGERHIGALRFEPPDVDLFARELRLPPPPTMGASGPCLVATLTDLKVTAEVRLSRRVIGKRTAISS
jgi:hypothetical protein